MITQLAEAGPKHRAIANGEEVVVYSSDTPLGANEVLNTPAIRDHVQDTLEGGEWIDYGQVTHIRVVVITDKSSASNGLVVAHTDDGENAESDEVLEASVTGGTDYDSGWLDIRDKGVGFRMSYTNGAQEQTSMYLRMSVTRIKMIEDKTEVAA